MAAIDYILVFLANPFYALVNLKSQFNLLTLLGGGLTATLFYLFVRRGRRLSLRGLFHYVIPKRLIRHPSTLLDFRLYIIAKTLLLLQATFIFSSAPAVKDTVLAGLEAGFGQGVVAGSPSITLTIATTILNLLALELGYWLAHWLMHRVGWLWEFHKIHHSAEIMTPLTEWRQHPMELLLFPVLISVATGTMTAIMVWSYGPEAQMLELWGSNAILLVFWYTVLHLRHSHVNLPATGFLGCIVQSPAHHHIHHSVERRHHDKNLGYCLSVWDWAFGTLYMPTKGQKITFGLGEEDPQLQTLSGSMWAPCVRAAASLGRSGKAVLERITSGNPTDSETSEGQ